MNDWTIAMCMVSLCWYMLDNPDRPVGWSSTAIEVCFIITGILTVVHTAEWFFQFLG
jgi:hypothetical protein